MNFKNRFPKNLISVGVLTLCAGVFLVANHKENNTRSYLDTNQHELNVSSEQFSTASSMTPPMSYAAQKYLQAMDASLLAQQQEQARHASLADAVWQESVKRSRAMGGRISETIKTRTQYFDPN